jgi:hypothetical protein
MGSKYKPWKEKPRNSYVYSMNISRKGGAMQDKRDKRGKHDDMRSYVDEWDAPDPKPIG